MSKIVSSIQPDADKTTKRPIPKIEWNNKTEESYLEQGFPIDDAPHYVFESNLEVRRFLSEVDIRQGPIERNIWRMKRIRAPDYDDPKRTQKEYLIIEEEWRGFNFRHVPIAPVSCHLIGFWKKTEKRPEINQDTGEIESYILGGHTDVYDLPFSKKAVDEAISKSAKSDKSSIQYIVKFSNAGNDRTYVTYDMFVGWTWEELETWFNKPKDQQREYLEMINKKKTAKTMNTSVT